MLRGLGFRLRKWYVDCVGPDGTAFIGYAARIGLGPIPLSYQAALWSPPQGDTVSVFTMVPASLPTLLEKELRWESHRLGVRGLWRRTTEGSHHVLLDTTNLRVEWRCHLPESEGSVTCSAGAGHGPGYAEELLIHGNPSESPFHELHWGRFSSIGCHIVWIEWRGPQPLRLVLLDGAEVPANQANERGVQFQGGSLRLHGKREIRAGDVDTSIFGDSRWKKGLIPGTLGDWREEKWLSRGRLSLPDGSKREGWVIHERVTRQ